MILLSIFILLQIADIWTTHVILKRGGRELNPFLATLFGEFGHLPVLFFVKSCAILIAWKVFVGTEVIHPLGSFPGEYALAVCCGWYSVVVIHNINQLRK